MFIPNVFTIDPTTKLAIPELNPKADVGWIAKSTTGITTIKIDGVGLKISWENENWLLQRWQPVLSQYIKCERYASALDAIIVSAFEQSSLKQTGNFVMYGCGINGNPHGAHGTFLARIQPAEQVLIVNRSYNGIRRGADVTLQEFYDSVKKELEESPEIEGLVWHLEGSGLQLQAIGKVERKNFGLPWPVVKPAEQPAIVH